MSGGERVIKRAKSATARLTSAKEPAPPTKERSLSAREVKELTRQAQESSAEIKKVFPRSGGIWKSYSWGRTSYSSDFGPKSGHFEPAKARPSSRTRRNNPHPNQVTKAGIWPLHIIIAMFHCRVSCNGEFQSDFTATGML